MNETSLVSAMLSNPISVVNDWTTNKPVMQPWLRRCNGKASWLLEGFSSFKGYVKIRCYSLSGLGAVLLENVTSGDFSRTNTLEPQG